MRRSPPTPRVHPRVCGGNKSWRLRIPEKPGPSPRVRGKPGTQLPLDHIGRSIPACAGETLVCVRRPVRHAVHPRVCGGNSDLGRNHALDDGPSPRVRGKPFRKHAHGHETRSIPRVCGGNLGNTLTANPDTGPSPRVRGKRPGRLPARTSRRSIPACAGETHSGPRRHPRRKVHPRVCGENSPAMATSRCSPVHPRVCGGNGFIVCVLDHRMGPSPRVRGKPEHRPVFITARGSIPACAGETEKSEAPDPPQEVHPRVCGGNGYTGGANHRLVRSIPACAGETSSDHYSGTQSAVHPRVCRGKPLQGEQDDHKRRSIPACAGETGAPRHGGPCPQVHPRVCGGNCTGPPDNEHMKGPSPRVRGKPGRQHDAARLNGSIPACAGETDAVPRGLAALPVHPRVCGGNHKPTDLAVYRKGPSPRVRGKPGCPTWSGARRWSIPACAGETYHLTLFRFLKPVHPRVCGGNASPHYPPPSVGGPSPRVRGKHDPEREGHERRRSIPACAGETNGEDELSIGYEVHPRVCGGNWSCAARFGPPTGPSPRVRGKRRGRPAG